MHRPSPPSADLFDALVAFDEGRAGRVLDTYRDRAGLSSLVRDLVLPVMKQVGDGWERGEVTVAQEHLATQVVRSYLGAQRRPPRWPGPQAWLACPPRELHDLPLLALGLLLEQQGWQVRFFGASTPLHDLLASVRIHRPELVVVSGDDPAHLRFCAVPLDLIAQETTLVLGGRAADIAGHGLPGRVLPPDVVQAAEELAALVPTTPE